MFNNLNLVKREFYPHLKENKMCLYKCVCYKKSAAWPSSEEHRINGKHDR